MSRHGQCRCGAVLKFRKRHGYKRRCPACGKIVRLQADNPAGELVPETPDDSHLFDDSSEAPSPPSLDDPGEHGGVSVIRGSVAVEAIAAAPPWTWQWLVVAGCLVVWIGFLSVLAWWWWWQ